MRELAEPARLLGERPLDQREEDFLFLVAGLVEESGIALLGAHAQMHEQRGVAAIVEDQVRRAAVTPFEDACACIPNNPRGSRP